MKKIIAILLCVALACSAFVVMASAEPVNVALNKSYTGGDAAIVNGTPSAYSANLTDGIASSEGTYDNSWFGFWYNTKSTEASNNCPDGVGTIVIDLEEVVNGITEIKVNTWNCNASGIAAATSITAFVSNDNETYEEVGTLDIPTVDDPAWATLSTDNISAKFVKLVFVIPGTWTFINEIEVLATPGSESEDSNEESSDVKESSDVVEESSDVVESSDASTESSATSSETPVKPGDASNMIIFAIVALVALAGSAVVIKTRR